MTPRVTPGRLRELGPVNWLTWRVASTATGTDDAQLFSTLGRTRGLYRSWLRYSARLMPFGALSRRDTELVILRVASLRACEYELRHHRRIAARVGLTPEQIEAAETTSTTSGWDERRVALLAAVDAIVRTKDVPAADWARLAEHYDERQLIALCLLVAQYDGLATTIAVLGIEPDRVTGAGRS